MKKFVLSVVAILVLLIGFFLFQYAPIHPAPYTPPRKLELTGVLASHNLLQKAELLALGKINGPEEVGRGQPGADVRRNPGRKDHASLAGRETGNLCRYPGGVPWASNSTGPG